MDGRLRLRLESMQQFWLLHSRRLGIRTTRHIDVIHETGSTQRITTPSQEDPSHGHSQHAQKFGELWTFGFQDMRADKHTDKQTYSSQHFGRFYRSVAVDD